MSSTTRPHTSPPPPSTTTGQTFFEQQREVLLKDIGISFEHILANINKLNRSLESVITVGNEFSSVEALWSQFENVMAKDPEGENPEGHGSSHHDGHEQDQEDEDTTQIERRPSR